MPMLSSADRELLGRMLYETVYPKENWYNIHPMERRQWIAGAVKMYTLNLDQIRPNTY